MNRISLSLFCLLLCLSSLLRADEAPLRTQLVLSINADQENWLGQQLTLNLDLKTTGLSFSNTNFKLPKITGAFFIQTDSSTVKFSENIDGQAWQIVRYPLALYPQKPGSLSIPPITVQFESTKGFGFKNQAFEKTTNLLKLEIKTPPGVKPGESVISTNDFKLDSAWDPSTEDANVGSAFTVTVTRRAANITAILFPPLPVYEVAGLAVYPQTAEIKDKSNRGTLTGERKDQIIWVAEAPGHYQIPDISFQWFDPASGELKQRTISGKQFEISNSGPGFSNSHSSDTGEGRLSISILFTLLISGLLIWRIKPMRAYRAGKTPAEDSEAGSYKLLKKACRENNAATSYSALHHWLGFYAEGISQPELICETDLPNSLNSLQEALINPELSWQGSQLLKQLSSFRDRLRAEKTVQLNPNLP